MVCPKCGAEISPQKTCAPHKYPAWEKPTVSQLARREGQLYPVTKIEFEGFIVLIKGVVASVKVEKKDG